MVDFLSINIGALYNKRKLQAKQAVDLHIYSATAIVGIVKDHKNHLYVYADHSY